MGSWSFLYTKSSHKRHDTLIFAMERLPKPRYSYYKVQELFIRESAKSLRRHPHGGMGELILIDFTIHRLLDNLTLTAYLEVSEIAK